LLFLQQLLWFDRSSIHRIAILLTIFLVVVATGCGSGGGSTVGSPSTPSTPSTPSATHSVTLSWTASVSPEVTGYLVYRRPTNSQTLVLLNQTPTASLMYVDLDVQAGQSLAYTVTAVDDQMMQSPPSQEVRVSIPQ